MKYKKINTIIGFFILAFTVQNAFAQVFRNIKFKMPTAWSSTVNATNVLSDYPRPQMVRNNWTNLNGLWDYSITKFDVEYNGSFDGKILVPYPVESSLSGVCKPLLPEERLWYKRTFTAPKLKKKERLILHFGAADWSAKIRVNGKQVCQHKGGYTAFSADITEVVKAGQNEIVASVYDPTDRGINPHGKQALDPQNIYYTATSGIWQTVWMEKVPEDYIESLTITPDIDKKVAFITVKSTKNSPVTILAAGEKVYGKANSEIKIPIRKLHMWSPENPYLYDLTVKLGEDQVKSYFGMRKISIQKDPNGIDRIFLNNMPYFNLGVLDQGFWPDGLYTAPTDEALAFDIKVIKSMGFNMIRKHIKVEPARWYYWADKIGMLVWQDMVNPNQSLPEGAKHAFEAQAKETLIQLHNYPSIVCWVLFNEKWGQYDQARLTGWIKSIDSSRIVNGHSGEYLYVNNKLRSPSTNPYIGADVTDVHSYPNPRLSLKQNGKAQVCGEFGGVSVSIPGHEWNDMTGWGYASIEAKEFPISYSRFIDTLKKLQSEGLSASVYTQPFDVENEENGFITYDRKIIKMPIEKIRGMNQRIVKSEFSKYNRDIIRYLNNPEYNSSIEEFAALRKRFDAGDRDSTLLRRLVIRANYLKKYDSLTTFGNEYIKHLKNGLIKENLEFISNFTNSPEDLGFSLFLTDSSRVNKVMGQNFAENHLTFIVYHTSIEPYVKDPGSDPDWRFLEKNLNKKFSMIPDIAENIFLKAKIVHLLNQNKKIEAIPAMFERIKKFSNKMSDDEINDNMFIILQVSDDLNILELAAKYQKAVVDRHLNDGDYLDTYASLLFKSGRKSEGLKLEEKAVKLSNGRKEIVDMYNKMKNEVLK